MALAALLRRLGHRRWFARILRPLVPADRAVGRLTRGRFVALRVSGLPSLLITTTGRRTGRPRTTPLLYAKDGPDFVVVGSNWGRHQQPAWSGNLLADPAATITLGGTSFPVRAELADGPQRDRLWALLMAVWPAYETYRSRAGGRDLRIFRLIRQDRSNHPA